MDHETNYLATSPNYSADIDDILQYDIWSTPDNESFKPFSFNPPSFLPSSSPSWTLYPSNTLFSPCQEISSPSLSSSLALSPYQPPDISASFWKPSPGLSSLITNEKEEKRNKWIEYMYNQLNKNNMEIKKLLDSEYHEQFKETLPPQLLQITYEILKDDFQKRHNTLTTEPNDNSSEDEMQLKLNNFNCLIQASRRKSLEHGEQIFSYRKNGKMIDAIKEFQLNDTLIRQRFFMKHVQKILKEQAIFRPIDSDAINRISKWMNDEFLNVRLELRKKFSTLLIQYNMERTDRRKLRRNFSHNVTQLLNKSFRRSAYPSEKTKRELADQCGISVAQKRLRVKSVLNHSSYTQSNSQQMSFSEMNEEENASNAPATSLAPTSTLEVGDNCTNGDNTIENDDMMNEVDELIKNTKKDIGMERNGDMNIDEELEKTTKLIPNGDVSHNNDNVIEFGDAMNEKQERSSRELDDDDDEELMKEEDECDDITNDTARYEEDVSQTDDPPHSMDHTADLHTQSNKQAVISIENRDEKDGQMNIENEDNSSNSQETATVNTADTAIRGIDSIEITGNEELLAEKEIIDEIDNQNTTAEISTRIDGNFSLGNNDDKEEITTSELNSEELDIRSGSLQQTFSTHSLSNGLEGMMLSDDGIPLELLNDNGDNNENEQNIEERVNVTEADINYDNNPPINRVENIINTNNLLGSMETEELIGTNMALNPDVMMEHIELNRPYIQVGDNVINQVEYGNDGDRCSSFNISGDGIETFTIDSTTAPTDNTDQIMNNDLHDSFNETSTTPSISDDVLQSSDDTSSTQPDNDNDNVTDLSLDETNENKQDMKLSEEKLSRQIVQLIDNNSQNVIDVNEEFENENNHNASPMVLFPKTDEKLENELKDSTQIQVDDKPNVEIISLHDSDSSPSKTVSDKLDHIQNGDHLDEIDSSEELQIVYKSEKIEAHNEMTRGMEENGDSSEKSEEHVEEKIEVIENSEAINGKFENVGKLTERSEDVEKLTDHSEDVEKLTKQSEDVEKLENSLNSQELETYKKSDEKVVDVNMLSYEAERDNIDVIVTENKNEIDEEIKKESEPKCTLMSLSSDEKARNNSVEILDISNDSAPVVVSMTNEEKRNETIDGEGDEKENKKMDKSTGVRRTTSPKIEWKRNLLECKEEKNDSINPNDLTNTEMAEGPVPEHQKASIAPELKVENDNEEETVDDISEKKKEETTSGLVTVIKKTENQTTNIPISVAVKEDVKETDNRANVPNPSSCCCILL